MPQPDARRPLASLITFCLMLAAAYCVAYPGVVAGAQTFFCRDYGSYSYPVAVYAKRSILHGSFPLWNPYSLNGLPFFAQWSPMVLYPPTIIYLILPTWYGLPLFMFLHLALGGIGMRQLLLSMTGKDRAASLAGFSFGFSGLPLSLLCWPAHCAAYGLAPWVILSSLRAARPSPPKRLAAAILVTALQMLTGSPEVIAATWAMAAAATLARHGRAALGRLLITWGLSVCLAAVQLLPFLSLLLNSNRLVESSLDWSMQPRSLLNFIAPLYRTEPTPYGFAFPENQKWLISYYVPFGLVAILFIAPKTIWRQRAFAASILLAGAGLILAMSPSLPAVTKLLALTPIGIVRYPIKYVLLTWLALHLAIGLALAETEDKRIKPTRFIGVLAAGAAVSAMLVLDGQMAAFRNFEVRLLLGLGLCATVLAASTRSALVLAVALLLLLIDVKTHTPLYPTISSRLFIEDSFGPALRRAGADRPALGASRLQRMEVGRIQESPTADHRARMELLSRNRNLIDAVPSAGGFYSMYLKDAARLSTSVYACEQCINAAASNYLDFIGISVEKGSVDGLRPRRGAMPLLTAGQAPVAPTGDEVQATLSADLRTQAILPGASGLFADPEASVESFDVTPHRIEAVAVAHTNTVLVVAQSYYPAWHAIVNGKPVRLMRANAAFQAVPLTAGRNVVRLAYEDDKLRAGAACSAAAACLVLALLFWPKEKGPNTT